jgi:hypothetical protein
MVPAVIQGPAEGRVRDRRSTATGGSGRQRRGGQRAVWARSSWGRPGAGESARADREGAATSADRAGRPGTRGRDDARVSALPRSPARRTPFSGPS